MMGKKKILYVATVDSHIKCFHLPYLEMMQKEGWETHVATNGHEKIPFCDKRHTICMERSPFKLDNIKAIKQMKQLLEKEHFDIIHCHTPMGSVVTRIAAKKARKNGTRVIYTAHGFHFYKGAPLLNWLLFYPVEKYLAKYTDTLITINQEDYNRAKKKFSKRCHDIQYVPGVGIDPKKFDFNMTAKEKHELRASLGLKDDDFVMICVGRLDKNKNQGFLIKCMPELIQNNPKIHLLLAGKDELNGKYQKLAQKLGVANNVHFLGNREDVPKLLKISDMALSSSLREGLPIGILEAINIGLTVVALKCRGIDDLKESGKIYLCKETQYIDTIKSITKTSKKTNSKNAINKFIINSTLELVSNIYNRKHGQVRILHVLTAMNRAGAETFLMNIYKNIDKNKIQFDFAVSTTNKCDYDEEIVKMGGKIYHYPRYKIINHFSYKKWWKNFYRSHDYKIVQGHIGSTASIYLKIANKYGLTTIAHSHSAGFGKGLHAIIYRLYSFPTRYIADYCFGCSEEAIVARYGKNSLNKKNTMIIKNGVNPDEYKYSKDDNAILRNKYKINNNTLVICTVGRLVETKNPYFILGILKKLSKRYNDYILIWLGDGELRKKIEMEISKNKLNNKVKMLGVVNNVPELLKISNVFILPSLFEGLPVAGVEAQAAEVPFICSDKVSKEICITDCCRMLPIDNPDVWVDAILNEKTFRRVEGSIRQIVEKGYDITSTSKNLEVFYLKESGDKC